MSDKNIDNIDFELLIKALNKSSFKLIIIEYNHYTLIDALKKKVKVYYSKRNISTFSFANSSSEKIISSIEKPDSDIILLEDFEFILNDPVKYIYFNQRRDKIVSNNVKLIIFLSSLNKSLQKFVANLPDIWSFRNLYLQFYTSDFNKNELFDVELKSIIENDSNEYPHHNSELTSLINRISFGLNNFPDDLGLVYSASLEVLTVLIRTPSNTFKEIDNFFVLLKRISIEKGYDSYFSKMKIDLINDLIKTYPLQSISSLLNEEMKNYLSNSKLSLLEDSSYLPLEYFLNFGSKRIRPLMTVLGSRLFESDWRKATKTAISIELFHNSTLIHDDLMDNAPIRRGKPTVHEKWNSNVALISGDILLLEATKILNELSPSIAKKAIAKFLITGVEVMRGQLLDMDFETKISVTEEEYLEMIRLKTSVLLGLSLELGGIIAKAKKDQLQLLYDVGVNIGMGFQLQDDLLDVYGDPEKFGKQVGGDIISNKKTYLLIKALEYSKGRNEEEELTYWLTLKQFNNQEKIASVTNIYNKLKIKELTEIKINAYFDTALEKMQKLNGYTAAKEELYSFFRVLIDRET
ncbi:MAG: polyprenyl synthetase family protein [Arcicella sp.]|nr:polyprenyl synthetase family protein [Arcicella sp.]